jgi:hypothetical protein
VRTEYPNAHAEVSHEVLCMCKDHERRGGRIVQLGLVRCTYSRLYNYMHGMKGFMHSLEVFVFLARLSAAAGLIS